MALFRLFAISDFNCADDGDVLIDLLATTPAEDLEIVNYGGDIDLLVQLIDSGEI